METQLRDQYLDIPTYKRLKWQEEAQRVIDTKTPISTVPRHIQMAVEYLLSK